MSKARIMSAGTVGTSKRVRVNGPEGGGNALQGLPPICNMRSALVPYVRTRADGENRNVVFCVNQLGGIGAKRGQFGPGNRSGVGQTGGCAGPGPVKIRGSLMTPPPSYDDLINDWDLDGDNDLSVGELIDANSAFYLFSNELDSDSDGLVSQNEYNDWLSSRNDSAHLGSKIGSYSIQPPAAEDWEGWTVDKSNYSMTANPWATSVILTLQPEGGGDDLKVKMSMSMIRMNYRAAHMGKTTLNEPHHHWGEAWKHMGSLGDNFQISDTGVYIKDGIYPLGVNVPVHFPKGREHVKPNNHFQLQFSKVGSGWDGTNLADVLLSANIIDTEGNIFEGDGSGSREEVIPLRIGFHKADANTNDKYRAVLGWAGKDAPTYVSGPRRGWDKAAEWSGGVGADEKLVYKLHTSPKDGHDWTFELNNNTDPKLNEFAHQPGFYCAALQINGNWYKPDISLQAYKNGDVGNGWFALVKCDPYYMHYVNDQGFPTNERRCRPSKCGNTISCMCNKPNWGCTTNHTPP